MKATGCKFSDGQTFLLPLNLAKSVNRLLDGCRAPNPLAIVVIRVPRSDENPRAYGVFRALRNDIDLGAVKLPPILAVAPTHCDCSVDGSLAENPGQKPTAEDTEGKTRDR